MNKILKKTIIPITAAASIAAGYGIVKNVGEQDLTKNYIKDYINNQTKASVFVDGTSDDYNIYINKIDDFKVYGEHNNYELYGLIVDGKEYVTPYKSTKIFIGEDALEKAEKYAKYLSQDKYDILTLGSEEVITNANSNAKIY